jgi:Short C-terminal domain
MNAWQMSIWCWVIFVAGMILMLPALLFGVVGIVVEQLVTWLAFAYGMYLSMAVIRGGDKRLARNGVPGTALVLSADQTNTVVQEGEFAWNAPYVWKYGLEVTVPGWQPYKTMLYICASLTEGETIPVRVAKFNHKRVTIDPVAYGQQYDKRVRQSPSASSAGSDDLDGVLANIQTLTSRLNDTKATVAEPDVADELAKLARLRDRGILTDAEFATQKAKLLAG